MYSIILCADAIILLITYMSSTDIFASQGKLIRKLKVTIFVWEDQSVHVVFLAQPEQSIIIFYI